MATFITLIFESLITINNNSPSIEKVFFNQEFQYNTTNEILNQATQNGAAVG